jgi:MFS family permease
LAFFLPSFFAGVPAPVLAQIAVTTQEDSGPALGAMFASGAVGAIAGTLLAGFVFIAWLGSTLTLVVVTLVYVASGLLCFWLGAVARAAACRGRTGVSCLGCLRGSRCRPRRNARSKAAISACAWRSCRPTR